MCCPWFAPASFIDLQCNDPYGPCFAKKKCEECTDMTGDSLYW